MYQFLEYQQDNSTLISATGCSGSTKLETSYHPTLLIPLAQYYNPNWGTPTLYFNAIPSSIHPMYFAVKNKGQVKEFKYHPTYADTNALVKYAPENSHGTLPTLSKWTDEVERAQRNFENFCSDNGLELHHKATIHPAVEIAFARYWMFHLYEPLAYTAVTMQVVMSTWDFIDSKIYNTVPRIGNFKFLAKKITTASTISTLAVMFSLVLAPFCQLPFDHFNQKDNVGINERCTATTKADTEHIELAGKIVDQQDAPDEL